MINVNKAIVIGCSGSGKSVFSRSFASLSGLPLYHLDLIYWNEDGTYISKDELRERLCEIMKGDEWIIDGNYGSTMEMRMAACDTVFFFDLPADICIDGIRSRKGKPRPDMRWRSPCEDDDAEFMKFVKNYNTENRPRVYELFEKYSDKNIIIFKSREEAAELLKSFRK